MGILEELTKKRLKWVEANRENGFEKGLRQLLTKLYPDNAHFIYELMQNAEDPRASKVRFVLTKDSLEFEHNGEKLFTLQDVESITSIGASSKLDDPTNIGEFGVGFKAVFDYTNTPEIHSGEFHFRIKDLVVPETNGVMKPKMGNRETRFSFPFDHPNKPPAQAKAEIERTLINLGDNTLLFLSNIRTIEYLLPDGSLGSLERVDHGGGRIEIHTRHPSGSQTISHWLRFQKEVEIQDESGETERHTIAIAFRLEKKKDNDKRKRESDWVIIPLDNGQVSIYFPAENEASNLRFHIHAPFASTVARDSVRNCQANRKLLNHIANLVVESLPSIRDEGMLTVGFLGVLPNHMDDLSTFYKPIREAVVCAFRSENLTPTKSGTHSPSISLYSGPAKISDTINDDDLSMLTDHEHSLWAANPPQQNQREGRFLESLDISEFSWADLIDRISIPYHLDDEETREHIQRIERWIEGKNDAWLFRFYALLGEALYEDNEDLDVQGFRIVRVELEQGHDHVMPEEAFFPPEQDTSSPQGIHFVKPSVYSKGRSEKYKRDATYFLEKLGVRRFDSKTVIELSLSKYDNNPPNPDESTHHKDIKDFISYWKKIPTDIDVFRNHRFLCGINVKGQMHWYSPIDLVMDNPYIETGLADLQVFHRTPMLWDGYNRNLNKSINEEFHRFLVAIGVGRFLQIRSLPCHLNPEWSYLLSVPGERFSSPIDKDYTIVRLDQMFEKPSLRVSRLVWQTMCNLPNCSIYLKATYQKSEQRGSRHAASLLVHTLRINAWVPQGNDLFVRPAEAIPKLLPDDFQFDSQWVWLEAIQFGLEVSRKSEEYIKNQSWARDYGFKSLEALNGWKELDNQGFSPEHVRRLLQQPQSSSQPEESAPNPERRRIAVRDRMENAPTRESVARERFIQPGARLETAEAKAYLRAKYKNNEGQTMCQCCHGGMPFKIGGEYYFEAVQCVRGLDHHFFENRLALCPNCAAMYKHARQTDDDELTRSIIEHEAPDTVSSVEIMVILACRNINIRFVGTHWLDLKTVLND